MSVSIYFLVDPRAPKGVRYVGKTETPRTRHLQHCAETVGSRKGNWIEGLRMDGIMPQMIIAAVVAPAISSAEEAKYIALYRSPILENTCAADRKAWRVSRLKGLNSVKRDTILAALEKHEWNKSKARQELGIGRQTLYNLIKRFDLESAAKEISSK